MAILISEEKKQFNWLPVLLISILLAFLILGAYFLFFTKAPLIEYITPSIQKTISDISTIKSDDFKSDIATAKKELQGKIKQTNVSPSSGSSVSGAGRENPFLNY